MTRTVLWALVGLGVGYGIYRISRRLLMPWDRGNAETLAEERKRVFGEE